MQNKINLLKNKINLLASQLGSDRIKKEVDHFDYFYIATTIRELVKSIKLCRELNIPFLVFGSGSKIIFPKEGFDGLGIKNRAGNLKIFGVKGKISQNGIGVEEALLEADSGVSLPALSQFAKKQGLIGMDTLKFEKGTIGGSLMIHPLLNNLITQIKILDNFDDQKTKITSEIQESDIILSAIFKLKAR